MHGRAIGQVVARVERDRVARARARIDLAREREQAVIARVDEPVRAIRIVEEALVGDHFQLQRADEALGQDLRHADAIAPAVDRLLKVGSIWSVIVSRRRTTSLPREKPMLIVVRSPNRSWLMPNEVGLGLVVVLFAVGVAEVVRGLAAQVLEPEAVLVALFLVFAGARDLDVDRGARDHVHVVVGADRVLLGELLAHQHRGAVNRHAAAVVAVIEHVGAIVRRARPRTRPRAAAPSDRAAPAWPGARTFHAVFMRPSSSVTAAAAAGAAQRAARAFARFEHVVEVGRRKRDSDRTT